MSKESDNKENLFYSTFIGELVELTTQFRVGDSQVVGSLTAYILDVDEDYYYLGDSPEEVSSVVKKEAIYSIMITKNKSWKEVMLDELGDKPSTDEIN